MEINYKKRFQELRDLNILYMVKSIGLTAFVDKLYEIDDSIIEESKKQVVKSGGKSIRNHP